MPLHGDLTTPAIVRKFGYLELPSRAASPDVEAMIGDRSASDPTSYMRVVQARRGLAEDVLSTLRAQVMASGGAAGLLPSHRAERERRWRRTTGSAEDLSKKPQRFTVWPQFRDNYRGLEDAGFLSYTVRGFFENGGTLCYVQLIAYEGNASDPSSSKAILDALTAGLETLAPYSDYDLVCVPDLFWQRRLPDDAEDVAELQREVMRHCNEAGDRMAILDGPPDTVISPASPAAVIDYRFRLFRLQGTGGIAMSGAAAGRNAAGANAALYHPWVLVSEGPDQTGGHVPPCGHVAGIYARTDQRVGAHKAPANEVIAGVIDLAVDVTNADQGELNSAGVNCLRAFHQRGIRVWGARTLSRDESWRYVNVRRVILTAVRWITFYMNDVAYEPHTEQLWAAITRELTAYLSDLARRGALAGGTDADAFYVKCDAETNPPEVRETGRVITEIGLQPGMPAEFIVIRIIHGPSGAEIVTQST